jgi:hypothetical protein
VFGWPTVAALVLVTLTVVLVLVVASLPWWVTWHDTYGTYAYPLGNPFCHEYACGDYTDSASLRNVFPPTYLLVLTALALSVLELVFLVGSIFWNWNRVGILVTGILGSIALLVAPIYFYFAFPISNFSIGSFSGSSTRSTWGGGPGWFIAFFVVAFFVVATNVAFFVALHIKPAGSVRVSSS